MKLFSSLSEIRKEHAIHMSEHRVIDDLLEGGFSGEPETPEDKEHFAKVQEALTHLKTLEKIEDKIEYLFENDITSELIFDRAYNIATTAFYLETDEVAFSIDEIDWNFSDDDDAEGEEVSEELPAITPKKEVSQLN